MALLADIFITTKGRPELLGATLCRLVETTNPKDFRLTIVFDGSDVPKNMEYARLAVDDLGLQMPHMLIHPENMGLGPSINQALAHIDTLNKWYEHPTHGDHEKVAPFICYLQDDVWPTRKDWLPYMAKMFDLQERQGRKIGFASGVECFEHEEGLIKIEAGMQLKDYIRAANMFARRSYWMSMFPIPRFDPETGRVRAKPNDGWGSGVDWHFIRNHENSVVKTSRKCLVIPGLLVHAGYKDSTWLPSGRELPESESDKKKIVEISGEIQKTIKQTMQ